MTEPKARRFTLVDALVLLAATAAAMAWVREVAASSSPELNILTTVCGVQVPRVPVGGWTVATGLHYAPHLAAAFGPAFAASWTLAVLALRLRRPRPGRRRLWRQPGAVAVLVAALALLGQAIDAMLRQTCFGWNEPNIAHQVLFATLESPDLAGFGVVVGWVALALGGRLRAEPSWLDRLGRLLGAVWVLLALDGRWIFLQEGIFTSPVMFMR